MSHMSRMFRMCGMSDKEKVQDIRGQDVREKPLNVIEQQDIVEQHISDLRFKRFGLYITTFEGDDPILTHVFWGDTLEDAVSVATSHLFSDFFFSSSFVGSMKWKGSMLILENEISVLMPRMNFASPKELKENLLNLSRKAQVIHAIQINSRLNQKIQDIIYKASEK
jgi:hypothetical protein